MLTEIHKIVACGVIYFLVVYMIVIRREARPVIPWTVCIICQVVSTVFFQRSVRFFKSFLPVEKFGSLGMVIPSALLCFGNLAVIYLMFGKYMSRINGKDIDYAETQENIKVAPLPVNANQNSQNAESAETESDITIGYIEKMISEGRKEEALKYLRMIAYYGKDEQSRAEASLMLSALENTENDVTV